ncbi:MAG: trehalase family glycosidase [bacterium]|nr:trehalase family glycosidase [bacterium]
MLSDFKPIYDCIREHWENSVRHITDDRGDLIGMPFPYTVPCPEGEEMQNYFYWDIYFINIGLIGHGLIELAKNNVDNLLFMVERYGFVPNGNRTFFLNRSQLPFLGLMLKQIFDETGDEQWLARAFQIWKKEYKFWKEKRMTTTGLNHHFHHSDKDNLLKFYHDELAYRIKFQPKNLEEKLEIAAYFLAEAETGWDFSPRFSGRCADFIPIELNCILYLCEKYAAQFSQILGEKESEEVWSQLAQQRQRLIHQFLWHEEQGFFYDYDFINDRHSPIASLAGFAPLWVNLASEKQAELVVKNLPRFEHEYGVAVCEQSEQKTVFQWDYPNGWAPMFYVVIQGLLNYDYKSDAERIAEKYLSVVTENYKTTGKLWEKYNVVEGSIRVKNEYEIVSMLGWTAGVFVYCYQLLFGK